MQLELDVYTLLPVTVTVGSSSAGCICLYHVCIACMCLYVSVCACGKTLSMKCAYHYVLQLIWGVNNGPHVLDERVDPTSSPIQADLGRLGQDLE